VLTNLKCPETQHPPFLYVEAITVKDIEKCMKDYLKERGLFQEKAFAFAQQFYNLDTYMDVILQRIMSQRQELSNHPKGRVPRVPRG